MPTNNNNNDSCTKCLRHNLLFGLVCITGGTSKERVGKPYRNTRKSGTVMGLRTKKLILIGGNRVRLTAIG